MAYPQQSSQITFERFRTTHKQLKEEADCYLGRRRRFVPHDHDDPLVGYVPVNVHLPLPVQTVAIERLAVVSSLLLRLSLEFLPVVVIGHVGGCCASVVTRWGRQCERALHWEKTKTQDRENNSSNSPAMTKLFSSQVKR